GVGFEADDLVPAEHLAQPLDARGRAWEPGLDVAAEATDHHRRSAHPVSTPLDAARVLLAKLRCTREGRLGKCGPLGTEQQTGRVEVPCERSALSCPLHRRGRPEGTRLAG